MNLLQPDQKAMNHKTLIRFAINERGESWLDYFSIGTEPIEEFHEEFVPGTRDQDRIKSELAGAKGLPRELKPRKHRQHREIA